MIRDLPNFINKELKKDKQFKHITQQALINLFDKNSDNYFIKDYIHAKIYASDNFYFLLVKNTDLNSLAIYNTPKVDTYNNPNPFEYTLQNLVNGKEFDLHPVLYLNTETNYLKNIEVPESKLREQSILQFLDKCYSDDKDFQEYLYSKLLKTEDLFQPFKTVIAPFLLKDFYDFMYNEGVLQHQITEEEWLNKFGPPLNQEVQQYIDDFDISLTLLFNVCDKKKFDGNNAYDSNDTYLYSYGEAIIIEREGYYHYITKQNNNFTIYLAFGEEGYTELKTIEQVAEKIENNTISLIDNVLIKVENGKVQYVNNALLNSFAIDLEFLVENLVKNKLGKLTYPVDTNDFDYQLAFHQHVFNLSKFDFLCTAFLISGLEYDKKSGQFTSIISHYSAEVLQHKAVEDTPINNLKFFDIKDKTAYPYLDQKWKSGLLYLINTLKDEKPLPEYGTLLEKKSALNISIEHLENIFNQLSNEPAIKTKKKM